MALVIKDRVKETTTSTGTGSITLAGAEEKYIAFGSVLSNSDTVYYAIEHSGSGVDEWEVGIGTYTASGTTLSRDTVFASSNSGNKVNFSAGTKDVFVSYPASMASFAAGGAVTENYTTLTGTYTMTPGKNGFSVGPVTIASGSSYTVGSGQRWVVI